MTKRVQLRRAWHRLLATKRGRVELGAFGLSVVLLTGLIFEVAPALADPEKLAGRPVPEAQVATVVSAALSCPTLTPPRVAAQLMAATGFATAARDGIAGMDERTWSRWKPAPKAQRSDPQAAILALAHRTCELIGQIRADKIDGDRWQLAVAAEHSSIEAVEHARGVPDADKSYVEKVVAFSNWYADQPQFDVAATTKVASPASTATAVPAALVADINAAGRLCPDVTPARIAAQLRAVSDFNPNLRSGSRQGIAQFTPELWDQYKGSRRASVWDPDAAIAALGSALCDLGDQFAGLSGADPYTLALGALQWGPTAIRMADGLPRASVPQLADEVRQYVADYAKDTRLTSRSEPVKPAGPSASPKPSGPDPSPASASPTAAASVASPASSPSPAAASRLYSTERTYQIQNVWAGAILDAPGKDVNPLASGARMHLWTPQRSKDQFWKIAPSPDGGYVTITNAYDGLNLAVENSSWDDGAVLWLVTANPGDTAQQWKLQDAGNGGVWITNRNSGKVMDLGGADQAAPEANNTWNGYPIDQWDRNTEQDQKWRLLGS